TCATSYALAVDAFDAAANRSAQATLTTSTAACPDTTNPTVSVTAPTVGGPPISGATNSVTATASDNVAVAGVQFYLDYLGNPATNKLGAEDTTGPSYSTNLNVTTMADGSTHTITAIARDAAGNTT